MATRSRAQPPIPPETMLIILPKEYKSQLEERIRLGQIILGKTIKTRQDLQDAKSEFSEWNHYNSEFLKHSFNLPNNEYRTAYEKSGSYTGRFFITSNRETDEVGDHKKYVQAKIDALNKFANSSHFLKSAVEPAATSAVPQTAESSKSKKNKNVFIVHGHNDTVKEQVARTLSKLGLVPIILHEQANQGKTIIEKIEIHAAEAGYAVVLLTSDDLGHAKVSDKPQPRARQNVILELGLFIGFLGRGHVFILKEEGVEVPSDIDGVVYNPLDPGGAWKYLLGRELKMAGYKVTLDNL